MNSFSVHIYSATGTELQSFSGSNLEIRVPEIKLDGKIIAILEPCSRKMQYLQSDGTMKLDECSISINSINRSKNWLDDELMLNWYRLREIM